MQLIRQHKLLIYFPTAYWLLPANSLSCRMKARLIFFISLLFASSGAAQEDYFHAEQLASEGKDKEASVVLMRLIDSNVYVTRPGLHMKTLNLAGEVNYTLHDTVRSEYCYRSAIRYYDTLNNSNKQNDFIRRERYIAYRELSQNACERNEAGKAIALLNECGPPGTFFTADANDLVIAEDQYYKMKSSAFRQMGRPDSAFWYLCRIQVNNPLYETGKIFRDPKNKLVNVVSVPFGQTVSGDADPGPGILYAATWKDELNTSNTIWAVQYASERNLLLGLSSPVKSDTAYFPDTVNELQLSADERWLAVSCQSEGSTWIEIIHFPELIALQTCKVRSTINPSPGNIRLRGWEGNFLRIESDADLLQLNKRDALTTDDLFETTEDVKTFLYDVEKTKFVKQSLPEGN